MSATRRPSIRGYVRASNDQFTTPAWCVEAILGALYSANSDLPETVLDPCCGDGSLLRTVEQHLLGAHKCEVSCKGIEIDDILAFRASKVCSVIEGDATAVGWPAADLIITNPPYSLAEEFVRKALAEVSQYSTIVMLLRLNWLASLRRAAFHCKHPADIYVLSKRPSFTGGRTDACEYAWFCWGQGRGNRWSIL